MYILHLLVGTANENINWSVHTALSSDSWKIKLHTLELPSHRDQVDEQCDNANRQADSGYDVISVLLCNALPSKIGTSGLAMLRDTFMRFHHHQHCYQTNFHLTYQVPWFPAPIEIYRTLRYWTDPPLHVILVEHWESFRIWQSTFQDKVSRPCSPEVCEGVQQLMAAFRKRSDAR